MLSNIFPDLYFPSALTPTVCIDTLLDSHRTSCTLTNTLFSFFSFCTHIVEGYGVNINANNFTKYTYYGKVECTSYILYTVAIYALKLSVPLNLLRYQPYQPRDQNETRRNFYQVPGVLMNCLVRTLGLDEVSSVDLPRSRRISGSSRGQVS